MDNLLSFPWFLEQEPILECWNPINAIIKRADCGASRISMSGPWLHLAKVLDPKTMLERGREVVEAMAIAYSGILKLLLAENIPDRNNIKPGRHPHWRQKSIPYNRGAWSSISSLGVSLLKGLWIQCETFTWPRVDFLKPSCAYHHGRNVLFSQKG